MALCYLDRAFCNAPCKTVDCKRNATLEIRERADKFGLPIAFMAFWRQCPEFVYDYDSAPTNPVHGGKLTEEQWKACTDL